MNRYLIGAVTAAWVLCACRAPFDPVVLRFEGVDVRMSAFDKQLESLAKTGTDTTDAATRASAFRGFVEERVVAIAAAHRGFREAIEDRSEAEKWIATTLPGIQITEAEAAAYYGTHPEVAEVEESVTIREILVETQQDARDVIRILGNDRNAFELLARTRSKSPHAAGGGLLGSFRRGELPREIEAAAFALAPGQTSGVVTSSFGYHVLRLEAKTARQTRSFAESRRDIETRLTEAKTRLRMKELIDGLVSRAQVNYEVVTVG